MANGDRTGREHTGTSDNVKWGYIGGTASTRFAEVASRLCSFLLYWLIRKQKQTTDPVKGRGFSTS